MYQETPFYPFLDNVYSQNGEDGVLEEILSRLELLDSRHEGWCVEFGAWDGKHLSNTFNLVEKHDFSAIYIEADEERFRELLVTMEGSESHRKIVPLNAFVSSNPNDSTSLDKLLRLTQVPQDFDVLSIDVDGRDLDIWETLNLYRPKVVVLEVNSSIFPGIYWRDDYLPQAHAWLHGSSFSAAVEQAHHLGYKLVCHTGNCIFVASEFLPMLKIPDRFIREPALLFRPDWLMPQKPTDGNVRLSSAQARSLLLTNVKGFVRTVAIALGLRKIFGRDFPD